MTEEVREALMRLSMCAKGDCAICKYAGDIGCSVEEQIAMVTDNARIIADALDRLEEEKHGWWVSVATTGGTKECSRCGYRTSAVGYYAPDQTGIPQTAPFNYCPCCGARMDGGSHEDD